MIIYLYKLQLTVGYDLITLKKIILNWCWCIKLALFFDVKFERVEEYV